MTEGDLRALHSSFVEEVGPVDIMLVGDGSGTTVGNPVGWCVHIFSPSSGKFRTIRGGASSGTNNLAELWPYVQALWHVHASLAKSGKAAGKLRVLVVSDSEVTVHCGNGRYQRSSNMALWAAVDWFRENGFDLVWRHVARNSNAASKLADKVAGEERKKYLAGPTQ